MAERTERILYHYTSFKSFLKILGSRTIWATDSRFLNDMSEVVIARRAISDLREDYGYRRLDFPFGYVGSHTLQKLEKDALENRLPPTYIASFSTAPDKLAQWKGYARGDIGICFGVRDRCLREAAERESFQLLDCNYIDDGEGYNGPGSIPHAAGIDSILNEYQPIHSWGYGDDPDNADELNAVELTDARLNKFYSLKKNRFINEMAAIKHDSWTEECEVRLVKTTDDKNSIRFRNDGHSTKPYVELSLPSDGNALLIDRVIFWASSSPIQTANYLQKLLEPKRVIGADGNPCEVIKSRNPFRPS